MDIEIDDVPAFKPGSFTCSGSLRTEIIIEDGFVVWEQWGTEGVQVGYNEKGLLVGVQFPEVLRSNRHT